MQQKKTAQFNQTLTDTQRSFSSVSLVAHALETAGCIFTRRMCSTPAVIVSTLVHVCTTI